MSQIHSWIISADGEIRPLASTIPPLPGNGDEYVWIDIHNPTAADLRPLGEHYGIHPLSIEDCLDEDQVPKVDDLTNYTFILVNRYAYRDDDLRMDEVDLMLGKKFLISVHRSDDDRALLCKRLEDAIRLDMDNVRKGPDFLLHVVLDYIVDEKFAAIDAFQEQLDCIEESILRSTDTFHPEALLRLRRNLLVMRKSLFHERELFVRICRKDSPFISDKAIYHFRDIYDHLARFFETTEICREMVSSHMEMYLSMVNHHMTVLANQTNRVMRRLTFITTIFMPLTLIAGIGGMSEWSMITGPDNWRLSYPLFLGIMVLLGVGNYYMLRWIERRPSLHHSSSRHDAGDETLTRPSVDT